MKKLIASVLVGIMAVGMAVPSFAETSRVMGNGDTITAAGGENTRGVFGRAYASETRMDDITSNLTAIMEDNQRRTASDTQNDTYEAYALISTSKRANDITTKASGRYGRSSRVWSATDIR